MTLIELMLALAIGAFLMIGAMTVFMQCRATFRVTESVSRLQENARFALEVIEPQIRMARFWGTAANAASIANRGGPRAADGPGPDACGRNWTIDLERAVESSNNSYRFACAGQAPVETAADTLTLRRASRDAEDLPLTGARTLRLQSVRGAGESLIFNGTTIPAGFDARTSRTHRLLVNGYYVSRSSSLGPGVPSLRVKTLLADGTIEDQEVIPGVEDLQVQFGVDTDPPDAAERGSIDRFVEPDDPLLDPNDAAFDPLAAILAVRVWLRVRAERAENGLRDTNAYVYADRNVGPFADDFRRVVVSKTVYLRNGGPSS
jgi:type IV pilus assembly protein PilW